MLCRGGKGPMDYENTCCNKIIKWDKKDYDEFINSFTEQELSEMVWYLEHEKNLSLEGYQYSNFDWKCTIVHDYCIDWLFEKLNEGIISGSRELFEVIMAIM